MTDTDDGRPTGIIPAAGTPTAPNTPANRTTYPVVKTKADRNGVLRVADNDDMRDAAVTATGADIDNDHADERPVDRSQDALEE